MFKELAYLKIKSGNTKAAVNILIENCGEDLASVVELAVAFDISDEILWNAILEKSMGSATKICKLLRYAEFYSQPGKFIDAFDDDACLSDVQAPLIDMFKRLKL